VVTSAPSPLNPEKTRLKIVTWLTFIIATLTIIPTITFLFFPSLIRKDLLDFIKWVVAIITPLFGTAVGFYFGGKSDN